MSISSRTAGIVSGTSLVIYGALKRGTAGAIAVGVGGAIAYLNLRNAPEAAPVGRQVMRASHTVEANPYDAFVSWKDLSQLPTVFSNLSGIKQLENGNWRIALPGFGQCEIAVTHAQPGHVIEWRSLEGGLVDGRGIIRFTRKKNGRGTKVHHEISFGAARPKGAPAPQPVLQKV